MKPVNALFKHGVDGNGRETFVNWRANMMEWILVYMLIQPFDDGLMFVQMERQIEVPYEGITEQEECEMQKSLIHVELEGKNFIVHCEPVLDSWW